MTESTQHKLDRVRPPRVQITYDVEIGDAIVMKELPFVGGIMADLSGKPETDVPRRDQEGKLVFDKDGNAEQDKGKPLPKLKDRKFVQIDRDNFNEVLKGINPRVDLRVANKLKNDDSALKVQLQFKNMEDFNPVNVLKQVEPLRKLYEARQRLSDLLTKLDGNEDLEKLLQEVVDKTEDLEKLKNLATVEEDKENG
ncbi:type VI secretion system contractile sheath small subunit [Desulfonema magnum]|uniref:Type VI secretion protein domain-containing protein n=1 Tax=Desulfonema magnum TaxID=45655 RepID=A0A975GLF9_9BACT|nr:type VI secretion system contractile sheath small subunit [Desulfonema magnum]QTA85796.1 Type VI secretion protein domain-containing protein [Desulfonema magnum]